VKQNAFMTILTEIMITCRDCSLKTGKLHADDFIPRNNFALDFLN